MRPSIHRSITLSRVQEAARRQQSTLDDPGFCTTCGHEQNGCEPDARAIRCESCGAEKVHGADELVHILLDWDET